MEIARDPLIALDVQPHPVTTEGRLLRVVGVTPGTTLADVVPDVAETLGRSVEAAVNGHVVPADAWGDVRLRDGAIVTVRAAVAGGGDTDPLRTVLQIAVAAVAFTVGGPWGAAIAIGGSLAINALVPLRPPDIPDLGGAAPSPVFSLTGGANRARPYAPLPLVLGRHRLFPDLGAAEFTEIEGEHQYLSGVYVWGLGSIAVTDIRIGDTPIDNFADVQRQFSDADGIQSLVAGNVDTTAGSDLTNTAWVTRAAAAGATKVGLDFAGRIYEINDSGEWVTRTVRVQIQLVAGSQTVSRTIVLANDDSTPIRRTETLTLPPRTDGLDTPWTVRVQRLDAPSDDNQISDAVSWVALRSYQPDDGDYAGQTRMALRIRASGQLSGRIDRLSGIVQQRVPVWNGSAWSAPVATSNPAWIFRWFARGVAVSGSTLFGAGLGAEQIDDATIQAWGAWCTTQRLECNHVLSGSQSAADVLALIARCGRASPTWQAGRLGVVYEDGLRAPSALVSPGNILAGSFAVSYETGPPLDEIIVRFIDQGSDWQFADVRRAVPGVTVPARSLTVTLPGVTSRLQAAREANLLAAAAAYHRRRVEWRMASDALTMLRRGDVVYCAHSLLAGGSAVGRATAYNATRTVLTLDADVEMAAGSYMLVALPDGALHTTTVTDADDADATGPTARVRLGAALPAPAAGDAPWQARDLRWIFYGGDEPPAKLRIIATTPQADRTMVVTAIDEDSRYFAAAGRDLTVDIGATRGKPPEVVAIYAWTASLPGTTGASVEVFIQIEVAGAWTGGTVTVNGEHRASLGAIERIAHWPSPRSGTIEIRVMPFGAPGGARTLTYQIDGPPASPPLFRWLGPWTSGTHYDAQSVVTYQGSSWIATRAHTSSASVKPPSTAGTSNAYWDSFVRAGADGEDGVPGEDGVGYEYVFARVSNAVYATLYTWRYPRNEWGFDRPGLSLQGEHVYAVTAASVAAIPTSQRPDNRWGFDSPGTAGGLRWYDAAPARTATQKLWVASRTVPGEAARGARPDGTSNWTAPRVTTAEIQPRGAELAAVRWHDDAPDLTDAESILLRSQRAVRGTPAVGAPVAAQWSVPVVVGRRGPKGADGEDGVPGADGVGYEYVFARVSNAVSASLDWWRYPRNEWGFDRPGLSLQGEAIYAVTAASVAAIPSSQRPDNRWGYDAGGTAGGLVWSDAAPARASGQKLWAATRTIAGDAARGALPDGTSNWNVPRVTTDELLPRGAELAPVRWHDDAPTLTDAEPILLRSQRPIRGTPAVGAPVAAQWSVPVVVGRRGPKGADAKIPELAPSSTPGHWSTWRHVYTVPDSEPAPDAGTYALISFTWSQSGYGVAVGSALVPFGSYDSSGNGLQARIVISSEGNTSRSDPIFLYATWPANHGGRKLFVRFSAGVNLANARFLRAVLIRPG